MISTFKNFFQYLRDRHERQMAIQALSVMNDHQLADIGIERPFLIDAVDGRLSQFVAGVRH